MPRKINKRKRLQAVRRLIEQKQNGYPAHSGLRAFRRDDAKLCAAVLGLLMAGVSKGLIR